MPLAMCASTGLVPQWYMKTPGLLGLEGEREGLARRDVDEVHVRRRERAAWKSTECGIGESFRSVTRTVWPWRACIDRAGHAAAERPGVVADPRGDLDHLVADAEVDLDDRARASAPAAPPGRPRARPRARRRSRARDPRSSASRPRRRRARPSHAGHLLRRRRPARAPQPASAPRGRPPTSAPSRSRAPRRGCRAGAPRSSALRASRGRAAPRCPASSPGACLPYLNVPPDSSLS